MPLPKNIKRELQFALASYAEEYDSLPDSIKFTLREAVETLLEMAKKVGLIDTLPEVNEITYQEGKLLVVIDGESIEISQEEKTEEEYVRV